jgi:hypothetical protein
MAFRTSFVLQQLFIAIQAVPTAHVYCPVNCTTLLQGALSSNVQHIVVHGDEHTLVGSPHHSTTLLANGTNKLIEFASGLVLTGFLNYSASYSPALVTLRVDGTNITFKPTSPSSINGGTSTSPILRTSTSTSTNTILRHITSYISGRTVRLEKLSFIDPGWDGLYARGIVGLTLLGCVFDRPYRNGVSVIDAVDMLAEGCTFSNTLPNGTGAISPMAGVDLEPNRHTDRLHNVTFRRCSSVNNSGAGFQTFIGALNSSSMPVTITFEDCTVSGIGRNPLMAPIVPDGYYFNSFGGKGAKGFIKVLGGSVIGTASFGAAVYAHSVIDPPITFQDVLFDHVAVNPGTVDPTLNFTNGPLIIAALGSRLNNHQMGGVVFTNVTVRVLQTGGVFQPENVRGGGRIGGTARRRPVLVVDGSGTTTGVADVGGTIAVMVMPASAADRRTHALSAVDEDGGGGGGDGDGNAGASVGAGAGAGAVGMLVNRGCSVVAGGWSDAITKGVQAGLAANITVHCMLPTDQP